MLSHIIKHVRGKIAHAKVDNVVGAFEKHVNTLNGSIDGINGAITSNAVQQYVLEDRNNSLRTQRERAKKVRDKLSEFVV